MNILVVVDMQRDFVDRALGTGEAAAIVPAVTEKIRAYAAQGDPIFVTLDTHGPDYLQTQEGRNLPVVHCVRGTPGWELDDAVAQALPDYAVTVEKPSFGSVKLPELIGEFVTVNGAENVNVELIGLCTDICVASNALLLKAFFPEMPISLDAKCCAGVTPEKHEAALDTMASCQIRIDNR